MNAFAAAPALLRPTRSWIKPCQVCPRHAYRRTFTTKMSASVTVQEAHARMQSESPPKYLDVRKPEEFADGHVPAALNIPVTLGGGVPEPTFAENVQKVAEKDAELLVGCKSGRRSTMAIAILQHAGFEKLVEVDGGFDAWAADSSLPVER